MCDGAKITWSNEVQSLREMCMDHGGHFFSDMVVFPILSLECDLMFSQKEMLGVAKKAMDNIAE